MTEQSRRAIQRVAAALTGDGSIVFSVLIGSRATPAGNMTVKQAGSGVGIKPMCSHMEFVPKFE